MIASVAMLLRHSLELHEEATIVEAAIEQAIADGARTADLAVDDESPLSTDEMTDHIISFLD
jgi:3-isopropylmalate dehydrogenase